MLIKARTILPVVTPPIADGMVCVEAGRVVDVGPEDKFRGRLAHQEVIDLGSSILLPGLINSHCHLDYMMMKGSIIPSDSFSSWIRQINGLKRMLVADDYLLSIHEGYEELLDHGTTTVVNIESFPEVFPRLTPPPLRVIWALELIDIRVRQDQPDFVDGMLLALNYPEEWLGGVALSPHAPYTASVDIYKLARDAARELGCLVTTHVSESDEEFDMFTLGKGNFAQFMKSIGRDMSDCGIHTPFQHLLRKGAVGDDDLLVHMNYLSEEDIVEAGRRGMTICHCPKSHHYFGHGEFPLIKLRDAGARVVLGTDSLASNNSLDLFSEMRAAKEKYPQLNYRQLLDMCTIDAARAIGKGGCLGQIAPGALADFVAVPATGFDDPFEDVCRFRDIVPFVMINGKVVRRDCVL